MSMMETEVATDEPEKGRRSGLAARPPWAKAAIVAVEEHDDCDTQTDYFATRTGRTVFLAWSKHTRDIFSEMRKAAARFPETAHLGPGCNVYRPRVVLVSDVLVRGSLYYKGQSSPWHKTDERTRFSSEKEALAYIEKSGVPEPINCDGTEVFFTWELGEESIEHREKHSMGAGYYLKAGHRYSSAWKVEKVRLDFPSSSELVARCFAQGDVCAKSPKMAARSKMPRERVERRETSIEKHFHTKGGFDFWIVTLPGRVADEDFRSCLDTAKSLKGWYSRRWGSTPAGFGFREESDAVEFSEYLKGVTPPKNSPPTGDTTTEAERLGRFSESLDRMAYEKENSGARTNTPKQQREEQARLHDAQNLRRAARIAGKMATMARDGENPSERVGARITKKALQEWANRPVSRDCGYYECRTDWDRFSDNSPAAQAARALLEAEDTIRAKKAQRLAELEARAMNGDRNGFFPTPRAVCERMAALGDLPQADSGEIILEPSAGAGAILDFLREHSPCKLVCGEIRGDLREILEIKGFGDNLKFRDFLDWTPEEGEKPDMAFMNPPFEKGMDCDHIRHAFDCIKPGGRVVAVCSEGVFQREFKREIAFRKWFNELGAESWKLDAGSFAQSGTNTSARILVIDKP